MALPASQQNIPTYLRVMRNVDPSIDGYDELMDALDHCLSSSRVRSIFGFFFMDLVKKQARPIARQIYEAGRHETPNPFAMAAYLTSSVAFNVWLSTYLRPTWSMNDAANQVLEDMVIEFQASDFMKTLLRISDTNWVHLLDQWPQVTNLCWTVPGRIERPSPTTARAIFDEPLTRYCIPGVFRGFMQLCGVEGEVEIEGFDLDSATIFVRW